jgi:hypothetical protein
MSRPPQSTAVDANQAELEEEETISGAGEGDEVMEGVEQQEGYSKPLPIHSQRILRISSLLQSFQRHQHRHPPSLGSAGSAHYPDTSISVKCPKTSSKMTLT